jgi:nitrogen fixation protein NifZ
MTATGHEALGLTDEITVGSEVIAVTELMQDGSYPDPDIARGRQLVPEGTLGRVVDVGSYLQRHTIYAVAFANGRMVGCMTGEIAPAPAGTRR